jgi:hypothetical protein
VANIIGGYESEPKVGLAAGVRFTPFSKARQQEAVAFLNDNVYKTPAWLLPADILRKVEPTSGQSRVLSLQQAALNSTLSAARLTRLQEHEAIVGDQAYTIAQILADVRGGIFTELGGDGAFKIDPYRRNLQRVFVELLGGRLTAAPPAAGAAAAPAAAPALRDDSRGAVRAELKALRTRIESRMNGGGDTATKNHLADLADQITLILEPKK